MASSAPLMHQIVHRYFWCLDNEDWAAMTELWTPDAQLRAVGARPRDGRDGVLGYLSKLFDPWPTHRDHPGRLIVSEEHQAVVAEVTFMGTNAHGSEVTFDAVDIFDFAGGRIHKLTNWYDLDYARRRLAAERAPDTSRITIPD